MKRIVDSIKKKKVFDDIMGMDDPSKIIATVGEGIINMLALVHTGKFAHTCLGWSCLQ